MSKISIALDNNSFFLVIFFVIFRVYIYKKVPKVMLFGYVSNCDISFKTSNYRWASFQFGFQWASNFTSLQKCSTNEFFNLESIISCHSIQHIILHRNLVCLAITNLK